MSARTLTLLLLAACGSEQPDDAPVADGVVQQPVSRAPQQTQDQLASDPNAMPVSGAVTCPDTPTGWTVEVYAIPLGDSTRSPDTLPDAAPITAAPVDDDGGFSMMVPRGARRLLVGRHPSGALAWGDLYGRYTEVVTEVVSLGLDCRIVPVVAPDGSRMASQGERVIEVVELELAPEEEAELAENQAWVGAVPAAPKVDAWGRAPEDMGGQETYDRIRARYRHRLTEEELNLLMPMLYQLSDQPRAADQLVDQTVQQRGSRDPRPRDPNLPEIR